MREKKASSDRPLLLFLLARSAAYKYVGTPGPHFTYFSDYYEMQVNVSNIDVALLENGRSVEGENTQRFLRTGSATERIRPD